MKITIWYSAPQNMKLNMGAQDDLNDYISLHEAAKYSGKTSTTIKSYAKMTTYRSGSDIKNERIYSYKSPLKLRYIIGADGLRYTKKEWVDDLLIELSRSRTSTNSRVPEHYKHKKIPRWNEDWVRSSEAARILGVTRQYVDQLVNHNHSKNVLDWDEHEFYGLVIYRSSVLEFQKNMKKQRVASLGQR